MFGTAASATVAGLTKYLPPAWEHAFSEMRACRPLYLRVLPALYHKIHYPPHTMSSIRERLLAAEDELLSAFIEGSSAIVSLTGKWELLQEDVAAAIASSSLDVETIDLAVAVSSRIEIIASSFEDVIGVTDEVHTSLDAELDTIFSQLALDDLEGEQIHQTVVPAATPTVPIHVAHEDPRLQPSIPSSVSLNPLLIFLLASCRPADRAWSYSSRVPSLVSDSGSDSDSDEENDELDNMPVSLIGKRCRDWAYGDNGDCFKLKRPRLAISSCALTRADIVRVDMRLTIPTMSSSGHALWAKHSRQTILLHHISVTMPLVS